MKTLAQCLLGAALLAQWPLPARLRTAALPDHQPPHAVGAAVVTLEATVDEAGAVREVVERHGSGAFAELLKAAVAGWRFEPVEGGGPETAWRVLVCGIFRAPVLGASLPQPLVPPDPAGPCGALPFPTRMLEPPYPANALGDGMVLVEVQVGDDGTVAGARAVLPHEPFTEAALLAARQWRFGPACYDGRAVPSTAYLVFGFRGPIVVPRR
jgi:TonB family protein